MASKKRPGLAVRFPIFHKRTRSWTQLMANNYQGNFSVTASPEEGPLRSATPNSHFRKQEKRNRKGLWWMHTYRFMKKKGALEVIVIVFIVSCLWWRNCAGHPTPSPCMYTSHPVQYFQFCACVHACVSERARGSAHVPQPVVPCLRSHYTELRRSRTVNKFTVQCSARPQRVPPRPCHPPRAAPRAAPLSPGRVWGDLICAERRIRRPGDPCPPWIKLGFQHSL